MIKLDESADLKSIGSALITAAIPLGGYALVDQFLYPNTNLFIFDVLANVAGFIIAGGAGAFLHRWANKR